MKLKNNGLLLLCLSNLFFGLLPVTVKWANQSGYSAVQVTFARFAFATAGILILAALGWQKLKFVNTRLLFWRGFFGGGTVLCYFLALHWTTVGAATLLNYTYSIWANVFAILFLKQKAPKGLGFLLLLAGAGVWLVLGARFDQMKAGDVAGFFSGLMGGAGVLSAKEARRTDNALSVFGSFTFFGLGLTALLLVSGKAAGVETLTHWTEVDGRGLGLLCLMGALGMAAQLFYTQGLGHASLAMGTLLAQLVPVLAAFFGWAVLGEGLTPHFILGTAFVLTACILLGLQEKRAIVPIE